MNQVFVRLKELLEERDLDTFLAEYEGCRAAQSVDPAITALTQRVFPPLLRRAFRDESMSPASIVRLYRLVRDVRLVLVETDLLAGINSRINDAMRQVEPELAHQPVPPLAVFDEDTATDVHWLSQPSLRSLRSSASSGLRSPWRAREVKRVVIASAFTLGVWASVDSCDFRKNACASEQEREFLKAVRQFFPSMRAYPNVPLKNFIDIGKLDAVVPARTRDFAWLSQVDVLLCTEDEDPVAGIELDSVHHDTSEATERDALKNQLFTLAGVPLFRIRADDEGAVRAEDFYDLLMAESKLFDEVRPRRLRPRRTQDFLVPAEAAFRVVPAKTQ